MEVDVTNSLESIQIIIINILASMNEGISSVIGFLPNPDPFTEILAVANFTGDEAAVIAFLWVNEFFDVAAITSIIFMWLSMFLGAWVIMMLWRWTKLVKN